MSSYGLTREKVKEAVNERFPRITLSQVIFGPWVLVPDGSLLGFFDWVPKHLRVGKWSPMAAPTLITLIFTLLHLRPEQKNKFNYDDHFSTYPELYSTNWWCSAIIFLFMFGLTYKVVQRFKGAVVTFTILSWILNTMRHGIHTLVPLIVQDGKPLGYVLSLIKFNKVLRFPALSSASITCFIWNVLLVPYLYFGLFDTWEKKRNFLAWNFNFRLSQIHVSNIVYTLLNTIVLTTGTKEGSTSIPLPHLFDEEDLWYGQTYGVVYGLFYILVLDRIGAHLYPIFSPRSNLVVLTWLGVFGAYLGCFRFWNHVMERLYVDGHSGYSQPLSLDTLICFNVIMMACCKFINYRIERKPNSTPQVSTSNEEPQK